MKEWLKHIIIFLSLVGFLGFGAMISGVIPVGASSGHWPITAYILSFAMSRSISTYSINKEAPIMHPWMVQKGAGHFEIGCRQCHGAPDVSSNFLGRQLTPKAPILAKEIHEWKKEELFQIVKHGVKFTGMPAWPNLKRDDEIWAMVAFLSELPSLRAEEYQSLVFGEKFKVEKNSHRGALQKCMNCHGVDGNGRETAAFPKLAGLDEEYIQNSLRAYKKGSRNSGIMQLAAASINEEMIIEFSRYFSQQQRSMGRVKEEWRESVIRGEKIAKFGIPEQRVASCVSCHGPVEKEKKLNPFYPQLAGQYAEYTVLQLELFLSDKRGESKYSHIMDKALTKMNDEQILDVSRYYESIPP